MRCSPTSWSCPSSTASCCTRSRAADERDGHAENVNLREVVGETVAQIEPAELLRMAARIKHAPSGYCALSSRLHCEGKHDWRPER